MKWITFAPGFGKALLATGLAVVAILGLVVAMVVAQVELPPAGSVALIQTSGPNTGLHIGDWYSRFDQGNQPHRIAAFVPCSVAATQPFTIELFDPELLSGTLAIDENRGLPDNATFQLLAPDNSLIISTTYPPLPATNHQWVTFANFDVGTWGCGIYTLQVTTADDDDNAWRLRITPDDPDMIPNSGDELALASFESSFQHPVPGCQEFFFFVPITASITLNNFDMDGPPLGSDPDATITYFPPGGAPISGTVSGPTVWNGGDSSNRGGDLIVNPPPGWWRVAICVKENNQYIFEPEGLPYLFEQPDSPAMAVTKDDGRTIISPGQLLTYTISFTNVSDLTATPGPALNVVIVDTLPTQTTYLPGSCTINLPFSGACIHNSGVVTFAINEIVHAGVSGSLSLAVQVNAGASGPVLNGVELGYEDSLRNIYPPLFDDDLDFIPPDLILVKDDGAAVKRAGQLLTYTLTYSNPTNTQATGVIITETVPANTRFNAAASQPSLWSCSDGSPPGTICTILIGVLPGGAIGWANFAVTIDNPLPPGVTTIENAALIADDGNNGPDLDPDNNDDTDSTPLLITDPRITKSADLNQANPGDEVDFSITISNPGPPSNSAATQVILTESLPLELDLVTFTLSAVPPGLIYTPTLMTQTVSTAGHPSGVTQTVTSTIRVNLAALEVNEALTLNVTARVNNLAFPPPQIILNLAVLDFAEGPPGQASVSVQVPSPPQTLADSSDDDDDTFSPVPTPQPPLAQEPLLPVTELPETGSKQRWPANRVMLTLGLLFVSLVGARLLLSTVRPRLQNKTNRQK